MLREKGLALDGVVELKVDEGILIRRIESRIRETLARGEPLRKDDDPEILKTRLEAYRRQTAPLIDHYRDKGLLRGVDGMAPIDEVTAAIDWIFQKPAAQSFRQSRPSPQKTQAKSAKAAAKPAAEAKAPAKAAKKPAKAQETGQETGQKPAQKPAKKAAKKPAGNRPGRRRKRRPGSSVRKKTRNAVNSGARRG